MNDEHTCEFAPAAGVECGAPATARWVGDDGTEDWLTCAEHEEFAEGWYERSPFPPWPAHLDTCQEADEEGPGRCDLDCPQLALARRQAVDWFHRGERVPDGRPY